MVVTPPPAAFSIATIGSPADNKPDSGDKIVYTYNEAMSLSSVMNGLTLNTPVNVNAVFSRSMGATSLNITSTPASAAITRTWAPYRWATPALRTTSRAASSGIHTVTLERHLNCIHQRRRPDGDHHWPRTGRVQASRLSPAPPRDVDAEHGGHQPGRRRLRPHRRHRDRRSEGELLMDLGPTTAWSGRRGGDPRSSPSCFMIIIALVLLALVTLAGNGLLNTSNLLQQQSLEYRSNGAAEVAVQTVRYTDTARTEVAAASRPDRRPSRSDWPVPEPARLRRLPSVPRLPAIRGATREVNVYAVRLDELLHLNYTVSATVDFQDGATCSPPPSERVAQTRASRAGSSTTPTADPAR